MNLKMTILFTKNQFLVKIKYCMTINNQHYVALSRAKSVSAIKIKWSYPQSENRKEKIRNIINHNILYMATNKIPQILLAPNQMDVDNDYQILRNIN
uniref:Uncharacterized protein n=1 Tax=Parastrongyloides trichosuri TaxID=131310 RepID=A0A0N4Z7F5_PARTI